VQADGQCRRRVSFEKKGGRVECDPSKADEKIIVDAVNTMGFKILRRVANNDY
jgi:hypothetical protein